MIANKWKNSNSLFGRIFDPWDGLLKSKVCEWEKVRKPKEIEIVWERAMKGRKKDKTATTKHWIRICTLANGKRFHCGLRAIEKMGWGGCCCAQKVSSKMYDIRRGRTNKSNVKINHSYVLCTKCTFTYTPVLFNALTSYAYERFFFSFPQWLRPVRHSSFQSLDIVWFQLDKKKHLLPVQSVLLSPAPLFLPPNGIFFLSHFFIKRVLFLVHTYIYNLVADSLKINVYNIIFKFIYAVCIDIFLYHYSTPELIQTVYHNDSCKCSVSLTTIINIYSFFLVGLLFRSAFKIVS